MKNIIFIIIVCLCLFFVVFGIWQKQNSSSKTNNTATNQTGNQDNNIDDSKNIMNNIDKASDVVAEVNNKKYYPDDINKNDAVSVDDSSRDFQITSALLVKMHLADTYNPGICFGEPTAVPQSAISSMMSSQKDLAEFLRQQYKLSSDLEVYNKIKQFQGFDLREVGSSKFDFIFKDGQCYYYEYYRGQAEVVGTKVEVKILEQSSHNYQ